MSNNDPSKLFLSYLSTPIGQNLREVTEDYKTYHLITEAQKETLLQNFFLALQDEYRKLEINSPQLSADINGVSSSFKTFKKSYDVTLENAFIKLSGSLYKSESLGIYAQCNVKEKNEKK